MHPRGPCSLFLLLLLTIIATTPPPSLVAQLFDQIYSEIKDRRSHQESMELAGAGKASRAKIAGEISSRMSKLEKLDKGRAAEAMLDMYGT